jgi:hypothetical protein
LAEDGAAFSASSAPFNAAEHARIVINKTLFEMHFIIISSTWVWWEWIQLGVTYKLKNNGPGSNSRV